MNNKKSVVHIGLIILAVAILVVGFLAFNPFRANAEVTGIPSPPPDETNKDKIKPLPIDPQPVPCQEGFCPKPLPQPCTPTGYFKSAYAYHKKKVGDSSNINRGAPLSFQFVVTSECTSNYYVEAGLLSKTRAPLTILVTQPSACDGSPHFAGKFVTGNRNTRFTSTQPAGVIDVAFFPQDYGKEEELTLVGGVYSNCLNKGGATITEITPQKLSIKNSYSDTDITNSVTKII